jgi:hypothetical protein
VLHVVTNNKRDVGVEARANSAFQHRTDKDFIFLSVGAFLLYPLARGHVHVTVPKSQDSIDFFVTGILTDK